jgi:branched-chain amino acid transport system substrate-binding protein
MIKIGVLLPRSSFHTSINIDIFEGLKEGFKYFKKDHFKVVSENIGFGTDKQICYRAAEKLLLEEDAEVVLAYIGHRTAELLKPLFLSVNKLLIVLDAGANMPNEYPTCPNIIFLSLHNALGARLTAKLATEKKLVKGAMITGYYDGGYLQTFSISESFTDFEGKIVFNHATGHSKQDFSVQILIPSTRPAT